MDNPKHTREQIEQIINESLSRLTTNKPPASGDLFGPEKVLDSVAMISFLNEVEKAFFRKFGQAAGIFETKIEDQAGIFTNVHKLRDFLLKKTGS